jgi:RHS repeat-associated protein
LQYTYDANGSLISDGVKTYAYDSANRLTQVSDPSGIMSMDYNGLGQRLSMDAAGVIAHYVMDGDRSLTAESAGNITFYLYGLGAIAEKTDAWSYPLPDGTNTPRQLTDVNGAINLTARYTPWGDALDTYGTGDFTFGYFGGVMDAATGLLYVGNGQYYDPATGRFLTRDARPGQINPYVPWSPLGAIFAPLAVLSMFYVRKRKRGKWDTLLICLVLGGALAMSLAACGPGGTPTPDNSVPVVPPGTPTPGGPVTVPSDPTSTPAPPIILPLPDCPTAPPTPTPIPTTDEDYRRLIDDRFGIILSNDGENWPTAHIQIAYGALSNIDSALRGMLKSLLATPKRFYHYSNDTDRYKGMTHDDYINFMVKNQFPYHLIYHEMGHLLDNALGDKFTYSLDHKAVYDAAGNWVMGRNCPEDIPVQECKEPYDRIKGIGYTLERIQDPAGFPVHAELHPPEEDGKSSQEDWGDIFANYVAGNLNLSTDAGRAKQTWVLLQLFGG